MVPRWGELRSVETKPTRATPHLSAYANGHFTVTQTTQSMQTCCPIMEKKTTCMYEKTLYMPHVLGQPPTHHPMQVPMGNQYRVSSDSYHTTRSLCNIYLIISCLFGQHNFSGSHRGSLTPSDIFRAFTDGYVV